MTRDELERVAEDLMERPVYVALQSEGVPEPIGGNLVGGCYSRRLDLHLKDWLVAAGRWSGRRPAVYVDDSEDDTPWFAWFLHELGHVSDVGFSATEFVFERTLEAETTAWLAKRDELPVQMNDSGHDPEHGPRFVRACCHLWHRSKHLGFPFDPTHLYSGELYNVPQAWVAIAALGDELKRLEQLDVATILLLPAPERFNQLFDGAQS